MMRRAWIRQLAPLAIGLILVLVMAEAEARRGGGGRGGGGGGGHRGGGRSFSRSSPARGGSFHGHRSYGSSRQATRQGGRSDRRDTRRDVHSERPRRRKSSISLTK